VIPNYNDNGCLPPGIHPATLEEIAAHFGQESEIRQAQMESLRWLIDLATESTLATDRNLVPKGMVEIIP
jgi:hypothetical protein